MFRFLYKFMQFLHSGQSLAVQLHSSFRWREKLVLQNHSQKIKAQRRKRFLIISEIYISLIFTLSANLSFPFFFFAGPSDSVAHQRQQLLEIIDPEIGPRKNGLRRGSSRHADRRRSRQDHGRTFRGSHLRRYDRLSIAKNFSDPEFFKITLGQGDPVWNVPSDYDLLIFQLDFHFFIWIRRSEIQFGREILIIFLFFLFPTRSRYRQV